ncbi:MAG: hypothetical protein ABEH35_04635 [Haloarculaceae archaeon]
MAELLTHVLVPYILLTVAGWVRGEIDDRWIAVAMGGAAIPDLVKVRLIVDPDMIEQALGIPFTFNHISTLGGVLLIAGIITVAFARRHWRRVYAFLIVGGLSSLVLDGMRVYADGRANLWLYPFLPAYRPPTPNLYVTSDPRVPVVAVLVSIVVLLVDRYVIDGVDKIRLRSASE